MGQPGCNGWLVSAPAAAWVALSTMGLSEHYGLSPLIILPCEEGDISVLSIGRGRASEEAG